MYKLNESEQAAMEKLRAVADEAILPNAVETDSQAKFPSSSVQALGEAGFLGLTVPTEYGGMGLSLKAGVAALDEIAQRCASTAMVYKMHLCGVACYTARPDAAAEELKLAAKGQHLSTLAWSEKGSRSHFWAPLGRAEEQGGDVLLSSEKSWVTSAGVADGYVVSTVSTSSSEPLAIDLYLVPAGAPGFKVSGVWDGLGMRGNASSPVTLEACPVSKKKLLCEPAKGFDTMLGVVLPVFLTGNAAISVGVSEAAVAATTKHLTGGTFQHLGSRLADLPNLRVRLGQMRIETDRSRAHLSQTLDAIEAGSPTAMVMVLESKASAAEGALAVTDLAMRACGGAAFSKHLGVERMFRDARAMGVMAPTSDMLHDFIGKALCGMELFA